ncbi:MAG: flippase-like domain-containing protein [Pseudomonadota bacterium]|nr:flippase-like domain-containing protein [Pseudomonadota bacterium]
MNRALVLRIAIAAILIALAVEFGSYANMANHLNMRLLAVVLAAQPLFFLSIALMAMRFAILARTPAAPFFLTFKAVLLAIGLNAILPGRLSELLKVTYLRDHAGISAASGMAALFLERLTDVIILGLLTLASISWLLLEATGATLALIAVAVALALLATLPRLEKLLVALAQRLPWHAVRRAIESFLAHLSGRVRDRHFYRAMLFGVAAWVLSWASVVVVLHFGGSIPIGLLGGLTVFVATTLGYAVPALPGGFGTFEAAGVIALTAFGYGFDEALALTLAMHVSQFLGTFGVALGIVLTERIGVASLLQQTLDLVRKRSQ